MKIITGYNWKAIAIFAFALLNIFIVGCNNSTDIYENISTNSMITRKLSWQEDTVIFYGYDNNGNDVLHQFNALSHKSSILCSDYDCMHNDRNYCFALKEKNFPFIFNGMLYWFVNSVSFDENNFIIEQTFIMQSSLYGDNEKIISFISGNIDISNVECVYIINNILYFIICNNNYSDNHITNESSYYLYLYDYNNNITQQVCQLAEGYNINFHAIGIANNTFYYSYSYTEDNIDFYELMLAQIYDFSPWISNDNKAVSINDGSIVYNPYNNIRYAHNNYLIYNDKEISYIVDLLSGGKREFHYKLIKNAITRINEETLIFFNNDYNIYSTYNTLSGERNDTATDLTVLVKPIYIYGDTVFAYIVDYMNENPIERWEYGSKWAEGNNKWWINEFGYISWNDFITGYYDSYCLLDVFAGVVVD